MFRVRWPAKLGGGGCADRMQGLKRRLWILASFFIIDREVIRAVHCIASVGSRGAGTEPYPCNTIEPGGFWGAWGNSLVSELQGPRVERGAVQLHGSAPFFLDRDRNFGNSKMCLKQKRSASANAVMSQGSIGSDSRVKIPRHSAALPYLHRKMIRYYFQDVYKICCFFELPSGLVT